MVAWRATAIVAAAAAVLAAVTDAGSAPSGLTSHANWVKGGSTGESLCAVGGARTCPGSRLGVGWRHVLFSVHPLTATHRRHPPPTPARSLGISLGRNRSPSPPPPRVEEEGGRSEERGCGADHHEGEGHAQHGAGRRRPHGRGEAWRQLEWSAWIVNAVSVARRRRSRGAVGTCWRRHDLSATTSATARLPPHDQPHRTAAATQPLTHPSVHPPHPRIRLRCTSRLVRWKSWTSSMAIP